MKKIEWRDIPNYKGYYQASNTGKIKSLKNNIILKDFSHPQGYRQLSLYKNSTQKTFKVEWLISAAFLGLKPKGLEVMHLDGSKDNNNINNLKYGTTKENQRQRLTDGTDNRGERHGKAILTKQNVLEARKLYKQGATQKSLAKKYKLGIRGMAYALTGKTWSWLKEDV